MKVDILTTISDYIGYNNISRLATIYNIPVIKFTGFLINAIIYNDLLYNLRYRLTICGEVYRLNKCIYSNFMWHTGWLDFYYKGIKILDAFDKNTYPLRYYEIEKDGIILTYELYEYDSVIINNYHKKYKNDTALYKCLDELYNYIMNKYHWQ